MKPVRPDTLLDDAMGEHPDESALLDFSAGVLGVAAADAVVVHLDTCSRCRQMLSSLTRSSPEALDADDDDKPDTQATRVGIDLLVGQMLGEYRVLERINQGGMGVLYRGEQPVIGKAVAIKVLLPEVAADPNLVHRLLGEARAVNSIRHPNIIDIFSLGQLPDGRHYMVMELLEGQSLAEMLRERGRLTPAEVQTVLEQALGALQAAHAAGVIHRDLKPENIFANPRADGWRITLLDFGLAKQRGSMSQLTAPNLVLGTPGYMAPEQIRGLEVTPAIDVYAMGIVAWSLLTGREPYSGGSIVEVMKRHLDAPVPMVRGHVPGVPAALESLVVRMMAKDPASRPSAEEARKIVVRLRNDARRFVQSAEVTQLVSPQTEPAGLKPVSPVTEPAGVKPVPMATASSLAQTLNDGMRMDPALLTTRPDSMPPRTLQTMPVFVEPLAVRKAPLIIAAIGLALMGGAVGLLFFRPPVPVEMPVDPVVEPAVQPAVEPPPGVEPTVEVDPPRRIPSRAEVERSLAVGRAKAPGLSGPTRKVVLQQLGRLEDRLRKNESPAVIARDLEKLVEDYDLR